MKRMLSTLLAVLLLTGCARAGGQSMSGDSSGLCDLRPVEDPAFLSYALAQPVYPDFPQQPRFPEGAGTEEEWDAYQEAYDKYIDALIAMQSEAVRPTEEECAAVVDFAARSIALALAEQEGTNAVYSPLSLWSALAMAAQCAQGESRRQVLDALGVDSVEVLQEQVSHLWQTLYTDDGLSALILGNSIWLNDGMEGSYVQDTLDALAQKYYAGVYSVPMGTGEADQAVSDWVREQTRGLMGGEGPIVQLQPDTLALLVSSLYYRAGWTDEFHDDQTEMDTFTGADGQEVRVDFMHQTQDAHFIRRESYQAAQLGTELGEMVFVLPAEGGAPETLLQDPEFLPDLDFSLDFPSEEDAAKAPIYGEVQWSVPKFDVDSSLDLKSALAALGVTDLLEPEKADLSALTNIEAFLSQVRQLARVKVDEEGIEAAAVTIMMVEPTSAMPEPDPEVCVMDLDRPFLFVIRSWQGVPLFVGVVNQLA